MGIIKSLVGFFPNGHRSAGKPVQYSTESPEEFTERLNQWHQEIMPLFALDSNIRRVADILLKASNGVLKPKHKPKLWKPAMAMRMHTDTFDNPQYRNLSFEIMKYVKSIV